MTPARDEKGRFVRADHVYPAAVNFADELEAEKARRTVLHRQVPEPTNMDGLPVPECWKHYPRDAEPAGWRHLLLLAVVLGLLIGAFAIGAEAML